MDSPTTRIDSSLCKALHWMARIVALLLILGIGVAQAAVKQPNGEYQTGMDDLSVKVLGGRITMARTWQADDLNKGRFRWYFNPAWADLKFTYDSIDGSVKSIKRSGSVFVRSGSGVFVFDQIYFIKQTPSAQGWRWYDPQGTWINYDPQGHISAYGDRNGVVASFARNGDGTISQLSDQNGEVVLTYHYSAGHLASISDYSGRTVSYQYSGDQLTGVTDASGHDWSYAYSAALLTRQTDPEGRITKILYNGNRVVRITDPMGYQTNYSYSYDHFKRAYTTVMTSPAGVRTETHYDAHGKVTKQMLGNRVLSSLVKDGSHVEFSVNERGLRTRTVYDTRRNPIEVTYPDGTTTSTTYDTVFNHVLIHTDSLGVQTRYQYDDKGNLIKKTEAAGKPEQRLSIYTYDSHGQTLTQTVKGMTVPVGVTPGPDDTQYQDATTTWTYDKHGNVGSLTDPMGGTTQYTYDVMGNVLSKKNARGYTTMYAYNASGALTDSTDPLSHGIAYGYDAVGNLTTSTDALNHTTSSHYNADNQKIESIDQLAGSVTRKYDKDGNLTKKCDQSTICWSYKFDSDGQLTLLADAGNNKVGLSYGDGSNGLSGLLVSVLYPTFTEQFKYDTRDRVTQDIRLLPGASSGQDERQVTARGYDAQGRTVSVTNPLGYTTLYGYDKLGRCTSITDRLSGVTRFSYDNRDNLLSVTDANGNEHRFTYDLAGHVTSETNPLGLSIAYQYDAAGNMTRRINRKGDRRVYTYDAAGRRIHEDQYPAGSQTPSQTIVYDYDQRNLLSNYTQTGDTQSSANYTYDAKQEKTSETVTYGSGSSAFSKTVRYTYFANGMKQSFSYPDATSVNYTYTANNALASVSIPDSGMIRFTDFVWNTPTQIQMPGVVRNVKLDPLQRPIHIKAQAIGSGTVDAPGGAIVMDYQYTYDGAGNITQRTTQDGEYDYTYDKLDRLTGATPPQSVQASASNPDGLPVEQYSYDQVHNRMSSAHQSGAWSYNAANELLNYGAGADQVSFAYDANGNTSKQLSGDPASPSDTREMHYDAAERLRQVDDNGATLATYEYDPTGRRIGKTVAGQTTWYQYADEGLVAQYTQDGTLTRAYGWKPNSSWGSKPLWMAEVAGAAWATYTYQTDHLGTPQRTTDNNGSITWAGLSTAFGKTTATVATISNPLRFPGQYFDTESGLYYNYSRNYEPETGRYIEYDPAGLGGGINAYSYVLNNPFNNSDLLGLCACPGGNWEQAKTFSFSNFGFSIAFGGMLGINWLTIKCSSIPGLTVHIRQITVGGGYMIGGNVGVSLFTRMHGIHDSRNFEGWDPNQCVGSVGPVSMSSNCNPSKHDGGVGVGKALPVKIKVPFGISARVGAGYASTYTHVVSDNCSEYDCD